MKTSKPDLIDYRLVRAKQTFEDAIILIEKERWNSAINRLYYAAYYAVSALLLSSESHPTTHNGAKSNFSSLFIKTGLIAPHFGRIYSQIFTWRQKGDYDDLFDFTPEKVLPYITPVKELIDTIEVYILDARRGGN